MSQIQRAINLLRARGADAHLWDFSSFREAYGAEFAAVENWNGATGDTVLDSGSGTFTTTSSSGYGSGCNVTGNAEIGKTYKLTFTILFSVVGPGVSTLIGSANATSSITVSGTYTGLARATTTGKAVIFANGAGSTFTVSNVSVREVLSASPGTTLPNVLYQDSAGTTPVTAPDQPIGLCLDSMGVLGSELVVNGDFSSATGWTAGAGWTIGSGSASGAATSGALYRLDFPAVVGKTYMVDTSGTTTSGQIAFEAGLSALSWVNVGTSVYVKATAANSQLTIWGNVFTGTIDNISVREISGVHCSQSTSAKKPTLRRGIVNRLKYSEDLTNAGGWTIDRAVCTRQASSSPDGTDSFRISFTPADTAARLISTPAPSIGSATYSFYAKTAVSGSTDIRAQVGANNQTITVSNTWTRYSVTGVTNGSAELYIRTNTSGNSADILIWHPQLETGSTPGTYAPTTSAPASSSQGRYWAEFDGVDDALTLGAVPFQMADDFAIVAASMSASTAAMENKIFALAGASGELLYISKISATQHRLLLKDTSGTLNTLDVNTVGFGVKCVITAIKQGSTLRVRLNGVTVLSGSFTLGAAPLTGARIGSDGVLNHYYLNGEIENVSAVKSTLTDAELLLIEKMAASKAGIAL